ncbi:MAG: hypothetical protein HFH38_03730 [Lachnospiraceae bacterium]|nr:hypothetical protein [Lachnospiraceae bacterium]
MLVSVKGYYDGEQIVIYEDDRKNLNIGDEVIITILDKINTQKIESRAEKGKRIIDSKAHVMLTGRSAEEIESYIKGLRDNRF